MNNQDTGLTRWTDSLPDNPTVADFSEFLPKPQLRMWFLNHEEAHRRAHEDNRRRFGNFDGLPVVDELALYDLRPAMQPTAACGDAAQGARRARRTGGTVSKSGDEPDADGDPDSDSSRRWATEVAA